MPENAAQCLHLYVLETATEALPAVQSSAFSLGVIPTVAQCHGQQHVWQLLHPLDSMKACGYNGSSSLSSLADASSVPLLSRSSISVLTSTTIAAMETG